MDPETKRQTRAALQRLIDLHYQTKTPNAITRSRITDELYTIGQMLCAALNFSND